MLILYICSMLNLKDSIIISSEILGGQPVFKGTRVPVESLFDYLEAGETLDSFLEEFPTVSKEHAIVVLEVAAQLMSSQNIVKIYETAA
jgi:uncharacterized protein (DUF433 family)